MKMLDYYSPNIVCKAVLYYVSLPLSLSLSLSSLSLSFFNDMTRPMQTEGGEEGEKKKKKKNTFKDLCHYEEFRIFFFFGRSLIHQLYEMKERRKIGQTTT